jgi:UDP-N-acetylmuramoyl-L-alanyl-D-glutamate--2,6-diaminopimelate ligase
VGAETRSMRPEHREPRSLTDLIDRFGFTSQAASNDVEITGITLSSADVRTGDLFVGLPGVHAHGASYAATAAAAGAVAILTDSEGAKLLGDAQLSVVLTDEPRSKLGAVAAWIYGTAQGAVPTFGVTGTNGKTSVVYLLTTVLRQMGISSGLSTTAERRIGERAMTSNLTTPESPELHALLACMAEAQVGAIALEISAQALSRHRIDGVVFDVVGFTNLSHDHFDDYAAFEDYFEAKAQLFSPERARRGVSLIDDEWGIRLASESHIPVTTLSSSSTTVADWHFEITSETPSAIGFRLSARDGRTLETSVPVMGRFMAANAALAIVMLVEGGHRFDVIAQVLERDGGFDVVIPGRAEIVSGELGPVVYVDYGHTPDAFEGLLTSLRAVTPGKVFMVFGADGDRDATKRHAMGAIAARGADVVIITDFHPRTEDPAVIRQALLSGARSVNSAAEIMEEADPQRAMRLAIRLATDADAILYAGPGHENYREVNGVHLDYNAREDVRAALREAGLPPLGEN